jgi:hypothetical protein
LFGFFFGFEVAVPGKHLSVPFGHFLRVGRLIESGCSSVSIRFRFDCSRQRLPLLPKSWRGLCYSAPRNRRFLGTPRA